ncbi:MAG: hypothetical protein M3410_16430 [Acidobacteriota bacterium]|nr:hypothetical protein [Acidobacteriota bacterium]
MENDRVGGGQQVAAYGGGGGQPVACPPARTGSQENVNDPSYVGTYRKEQ